MAEKPNRKIVKLYIEKIYVSISAINDESTEYLITIVTSVKVYV